MQGPCTQSWLLLLLLLLLSTDDDAHTRADSRTECIALPASWPPGMHRMSSVTSGRPKMSIRATNRAEQPVFHSVGGLTTVRACWVMVAAAACTRSRLDDVWRHASEHLVIGRRRHVTTWRNVDAVSAGPVRAITYNDAHYPNTNSNSTSQSRNMTASAV